VNTSFLLAKTLIKKHHHLDHTSPSETFDRNKVRKEERRKAAHSKNILATNKGELNLKGLLKRILEFILYVNGNPFGGFKRTYHDSVSVITLVGVWPINLERCKYESMES
jgi:hypothetical protein